MFGIADKESTKTRRTKQLYYTKRILLKSITMVIKRNATKNTSDLLLLNLSSLPRGGAGCNLCFIESLVSTAEYYMQFMHEQLSLHSLSTQAQRQCEQILGLSEGTM